MTKTLTSFTNIATTYSLTINEKEGIAIDCSCKAKQFNPVAPCKHQKEFNKAVQQAAMFILLQRQIKEMHETARSNRELAFSSY
jgi:hypothetical protein